MGAGMMHTGYYFWIFLAALANYFVGSRFGWRWMFVVGGVPALLVLFIRRGMSEPARWQEAKQNIATQKWTMRRSLPANFLAALPAAHAAQPDVPAGFDDRIVGRFGLRASGHYALAVKAGNSSFQSARLASYGTGILSIGTILGALSVPAIADRLGRRLNQAIFIR